MAQAKEELMPEPIVSREAISEQAREAARAWVANPKLPKPANPYPFGSDAAKAWKADFERWLLAESAPDGEGSA
jgi:hypothetical protein